MQAYKEIIQSIGIDFVVLYTDEGSRVTLQMCSLARDAPELARSHLRVFLPIFQIGPKTFNLMRLFVRYDTLQ